MAERLTGVDASEVLELIRELVEQDIAPWTRPYIGQFGGPMRAAHEPFSGGNAVFLACLREARGYSSRYWLTRRQAETAGTPFSSFDRGAVVLLPKFVQGNPNPVRYVGYRVWNADLAPGWMDPEIEVREIPEPTGAAAAIERLWGGVTYGADGAFYTPSTDTVSLPDRDSFRSFAHFMATLGHERAHQSGAEKRLKRSGVVNPIRFGSHEYADGELIAESAAACLLAYLGGSTDVLRTNSAAYLKSWLAKATPNPLALHKAMADGVKAAHFIIKAAGLPKF